MIIFIMNGGGVPVHESTVQRMKKKTNFSLEIFLFHYLQLCVLHSI